MPNRLIREGFLDSDRVNRLSADAECFYHRLLIAVDDAGRMDGRLEVLKARLYPLKAAIFLEQMRPWVAECVAARLVIRYSFHEQPFLQVTTWQSCGRTTISRYPWVDGSFAMGLVTIETRGGRRTFILTSIVNGIRIPSVPGADGILIPSASHPSPIPSASHADPIATPSGPHPDPMPMASASHAYPSCSETETETGNGDGVGFRGSLSEQARAEYHPEEVPERKPEPARPPSIEVAWPSEAEWVAYCDHIGLPAGQASVEWHAAERKDPPWKGIGNWKAHAGFCRAVWEQRGRPGPKASEVAGEKKPRKKWVSEIQKQIESVQKEILGAPANPESVKYTGQPAEGQVEQLRDLCKRLAGLEEEMRNLE